MSRGLWYNYFMIYFEFQVTNARDITGRFAGLEARAVARAEGLIREASQLAYEALYNAAPRSEYAAERGTVPGQTLAANIRLLPVEISGGRIQGGVVLPPVARFTLPPGTRPHTIRPRTAKRLAFVQRGVGFVRPLQVQHPGYQPSEDWAAEALSAIEPKVLGLLSNAGNFIIRSGG